MITYELAKKLKDAGFPQKSCQPENCLEGDFDCESCGSHFAYNPTLSELIEACGDKFFTLRRWVDTDLYCAMGTTTKFCKDEKTPEEAVANLYLALKQNDKN